jgi:hypothetical protein
VGDVVNAGQRIADVDNTGNSGGHHLHLQINLSTHYTHTNPEDWNWSQNTSRNPEVWLEEFNYNNTQTASVMGKVANADGYPVGNLLVWGMQKPFAAEGDTAHNFQTVRTYSYSWTNPDDIMVENFATTDIEPGTYCLEAKTGSIVYRNLGCHTFVAGRITYVGLYPVYLPDVRGAFSGGWTSSITVRNNSVVDTTQVNTSYFYPSGGVLSQTTNYIGPNASLTFNPPVGNNSAIVVASQDVAVVVETVYDTGGRYLAMSYPGETQPVTTTYAPLLLRNWPTLKPGWRQTTDLVLFNPNDQSAAVAVTVYDS